MHGLLSLQLGAAPPTQTPPEQVSLVVQALPSLQGAVLLVCTQPVDGLQLSSVHGLLSLQLIVVPPQTPPEQTSFAVQAPFWQVSPVVQALPSSHGKPLDVLVCTQPVPGVHESVVQTLPSSQFGAGPPTQVPPEQVSLVVQALPSLQGAVLLVCVQPVEGLQASVVQWLPS